MLCTMRTVLYIEDNLSCLRLVEQVMQNRPDIKLLSATRGRLGVDLARQHHLDLILLDLNLPDIKGDEVLHHLQADSGTRDIPVVIISADATSWQIQNLMAAGAREYLTKRFDLQQLLQVVDALLP